MIALHKYAGNVFRFSETVVANIGRKMVSVVGVNGDQDKVVVSGLKSKDVVVPISDLVITDDQKLILEAQCELAKSIFRSS